MRVFLPAPRPMQHRLAALEVLAVPDEALNAFAARVDQLNADVSRDAGKIPPFSKESPSDNQRAFATWQLATWLPWYAQWSLWRTAHADGLSRLPVSAGIEFAGWQSQYNVHLRTFQEFGGTSSAKPVDTEVPPPEPDDGDEPGILDRIASAFAGETLKYTAIGAALLGGYYLATRK